MRWLEVRRHSLTKKGSGRGRGSDLSAAGVMLARAVGAEIGQVEYIVTSTAPRAIETAVAMGFAVDDTVDLPSGYVSGEMARHEQWRWPEPFVRYAELLRANGSRLSAIAQDHLAVWRDAVNAVPDGARALVIAHGGGIEPALVACFPDAAHADWAGPMSHCDGARLAFDRGEFVDLTVRRAPPMRGLTDGNHPGQPQ